MSVFLLGVGVLVGVYLIVYNVAVKGRRCKSKVKLHGKTAVVTGSNTGIGKETALELARRGAKVILACRDKQRAENAVADIRRESGNQQVVYMHLDLASLKSVRSFAETFLKTESRLDLLINNAGVFKHGTTEDGVGLIFGVNHLGHFLLTNLLLERLRACAPSRVVNVSSKGHYSGRMDFACLSKHRELGTGSTLATYCHSKLCNVLFTRELAKRLEGTGVTCYSLHPGVIRTELVRDINQVLLVLVKPFAMLFFKDPEAGAQTTLHCALQEGLEPLSGHYFSNCAPTSPSAESQDDTVASKLWEVSERMCGWSGDTPKERAV